MIRPGAESHPRISSTIARWTGTSCRIRRLPLRPSPRLVVTTAHQPSLKVPRLSCWKEEGPKTSLPLPRSGATPSSFRRGARWARASRCKIPHPGGVTRPRDPCAASNGQQRSHPDGPMRTGPGQRCWPGRRDAAAEFPGHCRSRMGCHAPTDIKQQACTADCPGSACMKDGDVERGARREAGGAR